MKKYTSFKILQMAILVVLAILSLFLLLKPEVKQFVFSSRPATILFFLVWGLLLISFIFLMIDYNLISSIKLNYHTLYGVAYSDPVSGMPNRFSCDTIIEKYYDKKLPEDIGCVMIDFSNLTKINTMYTHADGNRLLKEFSNILSTAAASICFVGRNGGNKFLAIFEDCTEEKISLFFRRMEDCVAAHNKTPDAITIEYRTGVALNSDEHLDQITQLIALANRRIEQSANAERS